MVPVKVELPFTVKLPPTEAVPISRVLVNWLEAALKSHLPVMVSLKALEAGPLV